MTEVRVKNAQPDVPDQRDWIYQPALIELEDAIGPPVDLHILDQKSEGACTGFALAGAINLLYRFAGQNIKVSSRMLYEMAKRNDEWPGEDYDGSSLRGAIQGWKNMGVCAEEEWPYQMRRQGCLTIDRAKQARKNPVGAYYRLKPIVNHYHAALNEAKVIAVSARVHRGWDKLKDGRIKHVKRTDGGHAFIIVGYNNEGFWVQNSWDESWGDGGVALWSYEDWLENVMDAWVFRLALPTPKIFGKQAGASWLKDNQQGKTAKSAVDRARIAGHFVHIDDGAYKTSGRYWSTPEDVDQTARLVAEKTKYKHFLIYAHGGLNSPKDSARRIAALKDGFKRNGIYPFHVMYDTGIAEELKDIILRKESKASERVGGMSDWTDRFIEGLVRRPGTLLWGEMKQDACDAFAVKGAGTDMVTRFTKHFAANNRRIKLHLVGHSTGAVVIAHLLQRLRRQGLRFATCSLMAPACSIDLYHQAYLPVLQKKTALTLGDLRIYNLRDGLEQDDQVAKVYRKSLLYLVSNAFERDKEMPLLGMWKFRDKVQHVGTLPEFLYSDGLQGQRTRSTSHGGFDNDIYTMNHILKMVLGKASVEPFTQVELDY
ncbi:MAG: C1 family peptidase [Gammaproteobacteria bacterium]|nr:C1 family peptidase [Gammaproteobacteria bacterium]